MQKNHEIDTMMKISPDDLVPMDMFVGLVPFEIHLAYAVDEAPNIFGQIYRKDARFWLHEILAVIVILAAKKAQDKGCRLVLYDGLRTVEAQEKMAEAPIVKANPQWMKEPRLLSPPGAGAHPRGMAVDVSLMDGDGKLLDMGTVFDHLAEDQSPEKNPAHRAYPYLTLEQKQNRAALDECMQGAADMLLTSLVLLEQEWWDYRLPEEVYSFYAPLSDVDMPEDMRMTCGAAQSDVAQDVQKREKMLERIGAFLK